MVEKNNEIKYSFFYEVTLLQLYYLSHLHHSLVFISHFQFRGNEFLDSTRVVLLKYLEQLIMDPVGESNAKKSIFW